MYDDYDGPMQAEPTDEREALMSEFVRIDRHLDEMRERRCDLDQQIDKASAKQRELRSRLGDALGFSAVAAVDESMKAAFAKASIR